MPKKFDIAFVQSKNIGLRYFPVTQATVTFTAEGNEDPVTLQGMRDAVRDEFIATQKKVNDFIVSRNAQISRLGFNERRQHKDVALVDGGNLSIQKFLAEFKKAADANLEEFKRQEQAKAEKVAAGPTTAGFTLKWLISFGWTAIQGTKAVADMFGAEGPTEIYDGIKGFLDALNDMMSLFGKLQDYFANEATANTKVRAALKSLAGKRSFSEADAKALEEAVDLYETKVLGLEMTSKSLSGKLSRAIAAVPTKGIKPEAQQEAETKLDELLKAIIKLQTQLKTVQPKLKTYKLKAGAAKAFAKKEKAASWTSWAASQAYDFKDAIFAAWEGNFGELADELTDKAIEYLVNKFTNPENVIVPI